MLLFELKDAPATAYEECTRDVGHEVPDIAGASSMHLLLQDFRDDSECGCEVGGIPVALADVGRPAVSAVPVEDDAEGESAEHYGVYYLVGAREEGDVVVGKWMGSQREPADGEEADYRQRPCGQPIEKFPNRFHRYLYVVVVIIVVVVISASIRCQHINSLPAYSFDENVDNDENDENVKTTLRRPNS